jgi:pimeloyl-ACP methyl ester carboxylesterase
VEANDGVTLSYYAFGDGSNPVLFIHGWMVSGAIWDDMLSTFDTRHLRVIVPDLRGTGESDKPPTGYTLDRYADDIMTIVHAERIGRFTLIGHSMGGQLVQLLGTRYPGRIKGIAAMTPVPASGVELPPEAVELFRYSGENRELQSIILDLASVNMDPDAKERILDDAGLIPAQCILESFDAWTAGGFADQLYRIRAQTIVVGADDPFLPVDFLYQTVVDPIRGARFAYLPGSGHYIQIEKPDETAAILQAFLAGLPLHHH